MTGRARLAALVTRVGVVTVVSCFNFAEEFCFCDWLAGCQWRSGKVGQDCIEYVGDTDLCIDHLQHTEADYTVEEMGVPEEDGALFITVMMQM